MMMCTPHVGSRTRGDGRPPVVGPWRFAATGWGGIQLGRRKEESSSGRQRRSGRPIRDQVGGGGGARNGLCRIGPGLGFPGLAFAGMTFPGMAFPGMVFRRTRNGIPTLRDWHSE